MTEIHLHPDTDHSIEGLKVIKELLKSELKSASESESVIFSVIHDEWIVAINNFNGNFLVLHIINRYPPYNKTNSIKACSHIFEVGKNVTRKNKFFFSKKPIDIQYWNDISSAFYHNYAVKAIEKQLRYFSICTYKDNRIHEMITYKNGLKHGKYQAWNDDGLLTIEANYQNGKLHGEYLEYSVKNSQIYLSRKVKYVNGVVHDLEISYDSDQNVISRATYNNGAIVSMHFYNNGKLISKKEYSCLGKRIKSIETIYWREGEEEGEEAKVKCINTYIDDKLSGKCVEYNKEGKLINTCIYAGGHKTYEEYHK